MAKTKKIETHCYTTPTADNGDTPFSVGVMNLTKEEQRAVVGFVSQLIMARGNAFDYVREPPVTRYTTTSALVTDKPKPEPAPVEPRNRFSGLDIE